MFTKNRDRLLTTDVARKVLAAILAHREVAPLLSDEHFPVDGTLVKAFAMGLEPMATPWLTIHEEFSAQTGGRPCGWRQAGRPAAAAAAADAETPARTSPETAPKPAPRPPR